MAAGDATFVPVKNQAYRHYFYIFDNDGDPVTSAAGLDSEVSKDGGAFADCTNEATEVGNGLYYLDLTSTEMNADNVSVVTKTSTTDAKQACFTFYPQETGTEIKVDVTHIAGAAVSTSSAQLGVNVVNAGGTAWGSGAVTAAALATDAVNEIVDQVWEETLADHSGTAGSTAEALDNAGSLSSPLDAAGVRAAVGLASANLDTQLAALPTAVEISADLLATAVTELSAPPDMGSATVEDILVWLGMLAANRRTQTTSSETVYKSDGTTVAATSTKTDASGTFTRGEYA